MMAAKLGIHGQLQQICENVNLQLQFLAIALVDVEVPSSYLSTHSRNTSNKKIIKTPLLSQTLQLVPFLETKTVSSENPCHL